VFGCAGQKPDWLLPSHGRTSIQPPYGHVRLDIEETRESVTQPLEDDDPLPVGANGLSCGQLTVLDVVPLRENERPAGKRVALLP